MSLTYSPKTKEGSPLPDFSLPGTDGKTYSPASFEQADILVIAFTCNHCPYAKHAKPKLIALFEKFKDASVRFVAINPNDDVSHPEDSFEKMKMEENNYPFPYLCDEEQKIAKAFGAVCTPDIFVYDRNRTLVYRGQIDADRPGLSSVAANIVLKRNIKQKEVSECNLADAIETLLRGEKPNQDQKPSVGCSIKWAA